MICDSMRRAGVSGSGPRRHSELMSLRASDNAGTIRIIRQIPLALLLLLAGFVAVRAQDPRTTVTLTGTVLDQSAAVLSGAQVSLKGGVPSQSLETTTDASGRFHFEKLTAGAYEISVIIEGFRPTTARVTIGARAPAPVQIVL